MALKGPPGPMGYTGRPGPLVRDLWVPLPWRLGLIDGLGDDGDVVSVLGRPWKSWSEGREWRSWSPGPQRNPGVDGTSRQSRKKSEFINSQHAFHTQTAAAAVSHVVPLLLTGPSRSRRGPRDARRAGVQGNAS